MKALFIVLLSIMSTAAFAQAGCDPNHSGSHLGKGSQPGNKPCSNTNSGTTFKDGLGNTTFGDGTSAHTNSFGQTTYSDGTSSYTDSFGNTTYSDGASSHTDSFGNTTFSDGTSCYTDSFGNTSCKANNGQ